jgi:hypothetical protein
VSLSPGLRRFGLCLHVTSSVGLLGAICAFLVLAIASLTAGNERLVLGAYLAMDPIARWVILPLMFASLLSGLVLGLGTPWGLLRHYWVLIKLLVTSFAAAVLMVKMALIAEGARLAAAPVPDVVMLRQVGQQLLFHSAAGLTVLLLPMVLSIYKPRGLTRRGHRLQLRQAQSG